jgi:hypothetical protein
MSPYRIETEKKVPTNASSVQGDDAIVAWVWLGVGAVLISADAGQPGPWGTWSSLGMLISGLALVALYRHYAAKWRSRWAAR